MEIINSLIIKGLRIIINKKMNDAANLSNTKLEDKLSIIKTKLPNVDENKLKSLEARFLGPSSNGNLPYEFESIVDVNFDYIKSSKKFEFFFIKIFFLNLFYYRTF